MKRATLALAAACLTALLTAAPAMAEFGLKDLDVTFTDSNGSSVSQAGSHPFAMTSLLDVNTIENAKSEQVPDGAVKNLTVDLPPGFIANPRATPRCNNEDFLRELAEAIPACPDSTAVGIIGVRSPNPEGELAAFDKAAVFNLVPPPGVTAEFGFHILGVGVTLVAGVREGGERNAFAELTKLPQAEPFYGSELTLWGNPADPVHDSERGTCVVTEKSCPVSITEIPLLTLPRSCEGPLTTAFKAEPWIAPPAFAEGSATTHDDSLPPRPQGMSGCGKLGFSPTIDARPSVQSAESPTGLAFSLEVKDEGLTAPEGLAQSDIKKAVATLPEGVTVNPSAAEGLSVCTKANFDAERLDAARWEGCPEASKIGTIRVDTPLLENEPLEGALYQAQQDDPATITPRSENPFDSLLALYIVIRNDERGIFIKQAGKVEPDAVTGQLISTFDDIPQLPFSSFKLNFRGGPRAPLVTPPTCGTYTTRAVLTPWANPDRPITARSNFQVTSGLNGGPCPAGAAPFTPGFEAGSINNNAGSYSPFYMRLTRQDGEQDLTRFDSVLPPGVVGKIAGLAKCPEAAIAAAKTKSGREELAVPSCPAASQIGRTLSGAGVGSALTYVPGQIYLAGPFAGDPLSIVAITPAVAGPLDAGTVVVHEALTLDPSTAEVQVDGASSEPIPHILKGIPLKLRDLRVYVDRPSFTLNPTSCDEMATKATIFGGFLDVFSSADDVPVGLASRYQAANCAALSFKPKLSLKLTGGTKRGAHPALKAVVTPRLGDANFAKAVVTLPHSAFLAQDHIRTVCTRVQFKAKQCPPGSIYGRARAVTPLLDEPLEGPVYLRSSNHPLPDLVAALHGLVDINLVGRIDAVQARIRSSFESIPDAPVTKFTLEMQGGKKGLIVNSRNLCAHKSRASGDITGQNGKLHEVTPVVTASCKKGKKSQRAKRHARQR